MLCWVWQHVCRGENAAARTLLSHPTPPHPTPPHLETMPSWVWPQVCQRKERSCQDVIVPPHPTPPNPTPRIWRRCHVECGRKCDADFGFRIARMVVAESSFFGCGIGFFGFGIVFFWLRNRLFLVAESSFLVAEVAFFGCGSVFFWLRNRLFWLRKWLFWLRKRICSWLRTRRNLVAEASKYGCGIGLYSKTKISIQTDTVATDSNRYIYIIYIYIYLSIHQNSNQLNNIPSQSKCDLSIHPKHLLTPPTKASGNNKSTSGNISTSSAKLPIKSGNLQIPPVVNAQLLPRSCWDLVASANVQLLQSHRFAQNLEKICCAIDAFAVVAKAPGARWDRKDWTAKISIQSDTVASDSDIDPPKL